MLWNHGARRFTTASNPGYERGQDLAEFAIILPVLLLLILGILEFGILVFDYNTISNAAREGARYGIVHPSTPGDGRCDAAGSNSILSATCALTTGLTAGAVEVDTTVTSGSGTSLGKVTVIVTYDASLIAAPVIQAVGGAGTLSLSTSATMAREQ